METWRLILASLIFFASSCAEAPTRSRLPGSTPLTLCPWQSFLSPEIIGADSEIEVPEQDGTWRPGDQVIYGITLRSPSRFQQWLVRIKVHSCPEEVELSGKPPVSVLLEVETFDEKGMTQHSVGVRAPAADLDHGFYPGCLVGMRAEGSVTVEGHRVTSSPPSLTIEEAATVIRSLASFSALFRLSSSALKPIVDSVVARPSMTQILLHGGTIHLSILAGIFDATEPALPFPGVPDQILSFPFEVLAYESLALRGSLFVTDSRPPFLPGAGVVAIEAAHPENPASTVSVRLLMAKRGRTNR